MRKNEALIRKLCRPYCRYYKQDKNEDLLCRGAVVVERLILSGKNIFPPAKKKNRHHAGPATRALAVNHLCAACAFRQNDCDFAQDGTSQPCGGFVLILELLEQGVITIEDLQ
jgi:hypothetical protein